jgi:phage terminase large subunit
VPLSPKQKEYIDAVRSRKYKYLLYGGGVAGGKTIVTIGFLDEMAQQYPGTRYAVVRKSLSTIRRNTLPSYRKILDMNGDPGRMKFNKSEFTANYTNGSEIVFVEADIANDPELNKLRGLEITGVDIEEANECTELAFSTLITRVGRWKNYEYDIPPFILLTCNPDNNWVKTKWYEPWAEGKLKAPFYFQQALPGDNPYNSKEYLESLENLPEAEYQRYVKGNWEYGGDPNQLIQFAWYKECKTEIDKFACTPKFLGIDVAREGNDYSTLAFFDDHRLLWIERFKFDTCNPLRDIVKLRMETYKIPQHHVAVDGIGLGASLIDLLIEVKIFVEVFKSSESPESLPDGMEHFVFRNKRAESHWLWRNDIERGNIEICDDSELQKQSLALKYYVEEKFIKISDKKTIKKELGYSPDTAEAAIIGNYVRNQQIGGKIIFVKNKSARTQSVRTQRTLAPRVEAKTHVYAMEY